MDCPRMVDEDLVDPLPHPQDFAGCNINIGRLARDSRPHDQGLMNDNP